METKTKRGRARLRGRVTADGEALLASSAAPRPPVLPDTTGGWCLVGLVIASGGLRLGGLALVLVGPLGVWRVWSAWRRRAWGRGRITAPAAWTSVGLSVSAPGGPLCVGYGEIEGVEARSGGVLELRLPTDARVRFEVDDPASSDVARAMAEVRGRVASGRALRPLERALARHEQHNEAHIDARPLTPALRASLAEASRALGAERRRFLFEQLAARFPHVDIEALREQSGALALLDADEGALSSTSDSRPGKSPAQVPDGFTRTEPARSSRDA